MVKAKTSDKNVSVCNSCEFVMKFNLFLCHQFLVRSEGPAVYSHLEVKRASSFSSCFFFKKKNKQKSFGVQTGFIFEAEARSRGLRCSPCPSEASALGFAPPRYLRRLPPRQPTLPRAPSGCSPPELPRAPSPRDWKTHGARKPGAASVPRCGSRRLPRPGRAGPGRRRGPSPGAPRHPPPRRGGRPAPGRRSPGSRTPPLSPSSAPAAAARGSRIESGGFRPCRHPPRRSVTALPRRPAGTGGRAAAARRPAVTRRRPAPS